MVKKKKETPDHVFCPYVWISFWIFHSGIKERRLVKGNLWWSSCGGIGNTKNEVMAVSRDGLYIDYSLCFNSLTSWRGDPIHYFTNKDLDSLCHTTELGLFEIHPVL